MLILRPDPVAEQFLLSYDTDGDGELSLLEFQVALEVCVASA